jgi:hypothetical protein
MFTLPNEKSTQRLSARIVEVEENIKRINETLSNLRSRGHDTRVSLEMLSLASQHLDILEESLRIMQGSSPDSSLDISQVDQRTPMGRGSCR